MYKERERERKQLKRGEKLSVQFVFHPHIMYLLLLDIGCGHAFVLPHPDFELFCFRPNMQYRGTVNREKTKYIDQETARRAHTEGHLRQHRLWLDPL